ncbi:MAG: anthranilate synthase component I family protein [Pyrinomonadaceae bacterium]|nr:anthranilate synthase component I family protein [Sphingobacteriaceae bacterium]
MEIYSPEDINLFKVKALQWAASFETACYFDSNGYNDPYSAFDALIAAGVTEDIEQQSGTAFSKLNDFSQQTKSWVLGFFAYDLKNEIENLSSENQDQLNFPDLYFFKPRHLIKIKDGHVEIISANPDSVFESIENTIADPTDFEYTGQIQSRYSLAEYKSTVEKLKEHIKRGDVYEVTLCQEFYSENCSINPLSAFIALNKNSPTPFATFFKYKNRYIISATPERFLSRRGQKIISQPIKGTVKRSSIPSEDNILKKSLRENSKEQAENVMIVDLVRNDLTRCALPGTVEVEELFGIYSFQQVHQMISTVVCQANPQLSNAEIIQSIFPMGSMTGAPKISAMNLIEKYERTKRGVFSGAIGYFSPDGDFDFNVVIRSILYNAEKRYLSFHVGSAITFSSVADKEYEECLLKAKAIRQTLTH